MWLRPPLHVLLDCGQQQSDQNSDYRYDHQIRAHNILLVNTSCALRARALLWLAEPFGCFAVISDFTRFLALGGPALILFGFP